MRTVGETDSDNGAQDAATTTANDISTTTMVDNKWTGTDSATAVDNDAASTTD